MSKSILFLTLSIYSIFAIGQDTIVKIDNSKLIVKISEISEQSIKYSKFDYIDGPIYIINIKEVKEVILKNNEHIIYNSGLHNSDSTYSSINENKTPSRISTINKPSDEFVRIGFTYGGSISYMTSLPSIQEYTSETVYYDISSKYGYLSGFNLRYIYSKSWGFKLGANIQNFQFDENVTTYDKYSKTTSTSNFETHIRTLNAPIQFSFYKGKKYIFNIDFGLMISFPLKAYRNEEKHEYGFVRNSTIDFKEEITKVLFQEFTQAGITIEINKYTNVLVNFFQTYYLMDFVENSKQKGVMFGALIEINVKLD